ncbi:MAG: ankyrin repeat domain-containing protein [Verrucomicrobiaceae bacterium]|nr:MAG: ankyrin repeat domain-containing protein [Verrucomicrobiaceae bacterium]
MIEFTCSQCQTGIGAESSDGGKSAPCPSCGHPLSIPLLLVIDRSEATVPPGLHPLPTGPSASHRPPLPTARGPRKPQLLWPLVISLLCIAIWKGFSSAPSAPRHSASLEETDDGMEFTRACETDDLKAVKALVRQSGVSETASEGRPLNIASERGSARIVKFLIEEGAPVNEPDGWGRYPIHSAAEGGNLESLKVLEAAGADIKQPSAEARLDEINRTSRHFEPIHIAAKGGHLAVVRYLISRGVDPSVKDANEETPFNYAWTEGNQPTHELGKKCAAVMDYLKSISANSEPPPYKPIY